MDMEVHVHVICTALQFKTWHELFVWEMEGIVKSKNALESGEPAPHMSYDDFFRGKGENGALHATTGIYICHHRVEWL